MAFWRRIAALLLGLLLALTPMRSYAQSQEPTPPVTAFPRWEDVPDVMGYVSIAVPQCNSPAGNQLGITRIQPVVSWTDMGSVLAWLAWQFENTQVSATCWMFAGLQHGANALAVVANALILGVNAIARMLILWLLDIRGLALWLWYGLELFRALWWSLGDFFAGVMGFFVWIGQAIGAVFAWIGQFIGMLGSLVSALLGMVGWVIGLLGQLIMTVQQATQSSDLPTPAPLQATSTIYCALRGMLDGLLDSEIRWGMYLLYALAYIGFVYWASRFFSSGERSS